MLFVFHLLASKLTADRGAMRTKNHKSTGKAAWPGWLLLPALLLAPLPAWAYLDPTTGSMVISAVVGLFASLVLAVKTYWYKLKAFFRRKPAAAENEDRTG
jgi:hypothetical protein